MLYYLFRFVLYLLGFFNGCFSLFWMFICSFVFSSFPCIFFLRWVGSWQPITPLCHYRGLMFPYPHSKQGTHVIKHTTANDISNSLLRFRNFSFARTDVGLRFPVNRVKFWLITEIFHIWHRKNVENVLLRNYLLPKS